MIEIDHAARLAIEGNEDLTLVIKPKAEFPAKPIGRCLRLGADVLIESDAVVGALAVEDEVFGAEKQIVFGEIDLVIASVAERAGIRAVLRVPRAAAIERFRVVN